MRLPSFRLERRNIAMLQISDLYSARNRAVRVFNGWYFSSVCEPPASSSCHALFGRLIWSKVWMGSDLSNPTIGLPLTLESPLLELIRLYSTA